MCPPRGNVETFGNISSTEKTLIIINLKEVPIYTSHDRRTAYTLLSSGTELNAAFSYPERCKFLFLLTMHM